MTEQLLEVEGITAVLQVALCERVPEKVYRSLFYAAALIEVMHCIAKPPFAEHIAAIIRKKVIVRLAVSNTQILPKYADHFRTQRRDLHVLILRMAVGNGCAAQVYVRDFHVADSSSATPAIDQ